MFKLIKWMMFIVVVSFVCYGAKTFFELSDVEKAEVKLGARDAFEATVITSPLADKMKSDLTIKKDGFVAYFKDKLNFIFD